ncbi:MAG TPA: hypothetical protein DDW36_00575 [Candidatus Magasanikbacteria bacterium]|nr:hypothetical protein [Candidatus Magasanikbacteria bacterium]
MPTAFPEIQERLDHICERLVTAFDPKSIFLYGSRARGDHLETSDYEIGVVCTQENHINITAIKEAIRAKNVNIYPFVYEKMMTGTCDIPFVKPLFLRELKLTARTLYGDPVIDELVPPPIMLLDAIKSLRFNLGYALSALLAERAGAHRLGMNQFSKSNLFATRDCLLAQHGVFYTTYEEILNRALECLPPDAPWHELIKTAYNTRLNPGMVYSKLIYDNISFLNQYIEPKLNRLFQEKGNVTLLA